MEKWESEIRLRVQRYCTMTEKNIHDVVGHGGGLSEEGLVRKKQNHSRCLSEISIIWKRKSGNSGGYWAAMTLLFSGLLFGKCFLSRR